MNFNNQKPSEPQVPYPPFLSQPPKKKSRASAKRILTTLIILIVLGFIAFQIIRTPRRKTESITTEKVMSYYSLKKGELFANALSRCEVPDPLARKVIAGLRNCQFNFRQCKTGDRIRIVTEYLKNDSGINSPGVICQIEYQTNYDRIYEIHIDSTQNVSVAMVYKDFQNLTELVKGSIQSSLYESVIVAGEKPVLAANFADIFGWEIDFFVETQEGDSFFILIDKKYDDTIAVDYGKIYLVRYKGKIGDYYGVFYENPKGHYDYYDLEGKSLRKAFLRSPLRYSRISSYFSKARFHPILRIVRPHHGIDYVAPKGTPISAIGDGVVTFAGWKGSYGKLVEITHKNGYKSRYGHLSGFAQRIRTGRRVTQGQKVGYLGTTGLSTGPHLHFELLRYGRWVNPLRIIPPRAEPIKTQYLEEFYQTRDQLLEQLKQ
ncbi:MAG: M23 family metallopeptidase [candidate division WOR-3 bacterium]|nr:M23 family metallopeptidase [candidate division WOR-3 bacterium]MDH5683583.1 M23 family metallopeptidase [candidate division WOR-3 bacterium]